MRSLRKLTVTFNVNWPALIEKLGPTLVTYEIEPVGDVVKLTLIQSHDRPISDDILSGGRAGWPAILSSLKSLLETGSRDGHPDAAAATNAGGAEGIGNRDAVSYAHPFRVVPDAPGRRLIMPPPAR